jgi:hypothetical protein
MAKTSKFLNLEDIDAILAPIKKKKAEKLTETQDWIGFREQICDVL